MIMLVIKLTIKEFPFLLKVIQYMKQWVSVYCVRHLTFCVEIYGDHTVSVLQDNINGNMCLGHLSDLLISSGFVRCRPLCCHAPVVDFQPVSVGWWGTRFVNIMDFVALGPEPSKLMKSLKIFTPGHQAVRLLLAR